VGDWHAIIACQSIGKNAIDFFLMPIIQLELLTEPVSACKKPEHVIWYTGTADYGIFYTINSDSYQIFGGKVAVVRTLPLGLDQALKLTLDGVCPLPIERVELLEGLHRVLAQDVVAKVDSPSIDASLKDGYAVISSQLDGASKESPVRLELIGSMAAGGSDDLRVRPDTTVRVLTGAKIPQGANAVVAEEFVVADNRSVRVQIDAEPGRNILPKSCDVACGQTVARRGTPLTPGRVGLLAAAGHSHVEVVRRPNVAIIATGDEVVAPGRPLPDGKLYASNITTLGGWCRKYGLGIHLSVVKDDPQKLFGALEGAVAQFDAVVTSGGAWTGDRDLVAQTLERLGWRQVFHRIRIGPGKAVGFGTLGSTPVFILPGGPPSNLMGFLQIALPGLHKLSGFQHTGLPRADVRLATELTGRYSDWTQFIYGVLDRESDPVLFRHLDNKSRLRSMAEAEAIVAIPEGRTVLPSGSLVSAQLLE
jgi:molybdopterin molybdotransferase